ncbi:DEAD/DEAH box helicase family protein, partial [Vibrio parahaemolyticus]
AGWDNAPHQIREQHQLTDGRITVRGDKTSRGELYRADYLLSYNRDFPIAVVEAKPESAHVGKGMQQAKTYAEILGLKFAYATNGHEILEFDFLTGVEQVVSEYPTPEELIARLTSGEGLDTEASDRLLTAYHNAPGGFSPRYYQQIAINRTVLSILQGKKRNLITMATGTGKTVVAFQICWKLWNSRWNASGEYRKPRILFLADRNVLVDDPKDKTFSPFGDARHKIEG